MPRIARKGLGTSFFHVIVQGINKEYVFYKNEHIEKYLELINKHIENYDIELLSYCIMNNHAHLLIYSENTKEMAKFMHKINCIYAQYYNKMENRVGVLFRNRYVSEPIYTVDYLINCIQYIHMNPVKANIVTDASKYKYSSYNDYVRNEGVSKNKVLIDIFGTPDWVKIFEMIDDSIIFKDIDGNDEDIIDMVISRFEKEAGMSLKEIIKEDEMFRKLIKILKENYKVTYTQIAEKCKINRGKFQYFLRK